MRNAIRRAAATALLSAALVVGSATLAGARPVSSAGPASYEDCVKKGGSVRGCCADFGGIYTKETKEWTDENGVRRTKTREGCQGYGNKKQSSYSSSSRATYSSGSAYAQR